MTATNIVATLPNSLTGITQDSSGCTSVAPQGSCQLKFTATTALNSKTLIAIKGDNTNTAFASLTVAVPWVTNGDVNAVVFDPVKSLLYIGGNFTRVGPNNANGGPIDVSTGKALDSVPLVNGQIFTVISDGNGGWYIGGDFTTVGGVERNRIAHILSNYSVDSAWNPNADDRVSSLAISSDGKTIYAGGSFLNIGGQARNYIAAIDASIGTATSWNPNSNTLVLALTINGTTVYTGLNFSSRSLINNQPVAGFAIINQ